MASTRLGRYEIVKTLGRGALTDLLLGRSRGMEGFQRYVAIKQLRPEHAADPRCFEEFVAEARLAAVLHHHNIVQVHDIDQDGGQPYFAMEYVHGVDLRTLLNRLAKRNEQLPLQHVVSIVASAAAALHHAHEQRGSDGEPLNIVHRDVTPANILVGYDGNVKVVDFGIAKAAISRTTDVGVLKGQVPYMAPEMCAGQPVDRRGDVFSLGIVLYELATVRRLFKGATDFHTMSAICNADVPRPSQYRRDIPPELEAIMLKALARDPAKRFQTAGDMSLALDRVATTVGVGATTTALASYMRLQFGEQKEPWLVAPVEEDEEESEPTLVDFDGGASGLAPPAEESMEKLAIPKVITASKASPIVQARTVALTPATPSPIDLHAAVPFGAAARPGKTAALDRGSLPLPAPRLRGKTRPPPVDRPVPPGVAPAAAESSDPDAQIATEPRISRPVLPELVDATAQVPPLTAYASLDVPPPRRGSRGVWWLFAAMCVSGAIVGGIVLWPASELVPAENRELVDLKAAPLRDPVVLEPEPEPAPAPEPADPSRPAMEMTMRDYEEAKLQRETAKEQAEMEKAARAAAAELERQAAEEKRALEAEPEPIAAQPEPEPVAKKPAAKRTTAKPPAKRTTAKPAQTAEKKPDPKPAKKPTWNPDDLFLDEK